MIYCITVTSKKQGTVYTKTLETSITDEDELRLELSDFVDSAIYDLKIDSEILDMEDLSVDFQKFE